MAIADALQNCRERITAACREAGRRDDCASLLAVSKTFPPADVRAAWAAGQRCFGESYVQEAVAKIAALADLPIEWHFIGPIQSNKTRLIAAHFDWVHGIERLNIAERLSAQREPTRAGLNVCIQVNVSGEASKHGVAPEDALRLAQDVAALPNLRLRGFMAIPEPTPEAAVRRARFRVLTELLAHAQAAGLALDTLSMGMSADMQEAIHEGATLVRVGTAIFGAR